MKATQPDLSATDLLKSAIASDPLMKMSLEANGTKLADLNLKQMQQVITGGSGDLSKFIDLTKRIATTIIESPRFENPLKLFRGDIPLGGSIQDIYQQMVPGETFETSGEGVLDYNPAKLSEFIIDARKELRYDISVSEADMLQAFVSDAALTNLFDRIVQSLSVSQQRDEYNNMLLSIEEGILNGEGKVVGIKPDADEKTFNENLLVQLMTESDNMVFGSHDNLDGKFMTTAKSDQILLITTEVRARLKVRTYAGAYNLSELQLDPEMIQAVPSLGVDADGNKVLAVLADKKKFLFYRNLETVKSMENVKGLFTNFFRHFWANYARSPFRNQVTFVEAKNATAPTLRLSQHGLIMGSNDKFVLDIKGYNGTLAEGVSAKNPHIGVLSGQPNAPILAYVTDKSGTDGAVDPTKAVTSGYISVTPDFEAGTLTISTQQVQDGFTASQAVALIGSDNKIIDKVAVSIQG